WIILVLVGRGGGRRRRPEPAARLEVPRARVRLRWRPRREGRLERGDRRAGWAARTAVEQHAHAPRRFARRERGRVVRRGVETIGWQRDDAAGAGRQRDACDEPRRR